jgi:hypothetical protein
MTETPQPPRERHSLFDRLRGPMTLLMLAVAGFAFYYSLFFERKTSYFRERNARMVGRLAEQMRRSLTSTGRIVASAATVPEDELNGLYRFDRGLTDEQRQAQAIFDSIALHPLTVPYPEDRRVIRRVGDTLRLVFTMKPRRREGFVADKYAVAEIQVQRFINTIVTQTARDVFDTVFILDSAGNVLYQSVPLQDEESESDVKIVRVTELRVPRLFSDVTTVKVSELMLASRQMPVQIGDANYQLFSVPLRSGVEIEGEPPTKDAAGVPSDTWVVCGMVANGTFRASSLALSVTVLACLAAVVLLTLFVWPFMKMAMMGAQHKITLIDVVLLGISGILATSLICVVVLDWYAYGKLEATADRQLETLAGQITRNFRAEIYAAIEQLDDLQEWIEAQPDLESQPVRQGNLLASLATIRQPFFQSVALLAGGWQVRKWSVDTVPVPLTYVDSRRYYSAPLKGGTEYLSIRDRRIAIESVRSQTSGQPEVVFARRTSDTNPPRTNAFREKYPVIAMSKPNALAMIDPILPQDFGFAIIDQSGTVLFHSQRHRNTIENFFAETDDDKRVKAAVDARQEEQIDIRYWGEDYRAYIHPMKDLPWTLVTFRQKAPLRTLNADALSITMVLLLVISGFLPIAFIALVLVLRPGYRAPWAWPAPERVRAYAELAGAYVALLAVAAVLLLTFDESALMMFPFWFVPLALIVTYFYLNDRLRGVKRMLFVIAAAALTSCMLVLMWRARSGSLSDGWLLAAALLLLVAGARAVLRHDQLPEPRHLRERQAALPLCYVGAGFLLLLLTSAVPASAFFKAAYEMETRTYVKRVQMKLARDLQNRWWRISWEFDDKRGVNKAAYREARWQELRDLYSAAALDTRVSLDRMTARKSGRSKELPRFIQTLLPRYSASSANTRELVSDRAADDSWWWTHDGAEMSLTVRNPPPLRPVTIASTIPALLPSMHTLDVPGRSTARPAAVTIIALLLICTVAFAVAHFIARRVFLVDLVHPLWLSKGFLGLRNVLAYPCDDAAAQQLFREFRTIDLATDEGLELARTAPQSFAVFEAAVLIDGLDYEHGTGEKSEIVRGLLERLTRNADRTVVLRPAAMNVITAAFLQGADREAWARTLSSFVWVNGSQLSSNAGSLTLSGAHVPFNPEESQSSSRWHMRSLQGIYILSGFDAYFDQLTDTRRAIERTLARETEADPYLRTLLGGLSKYASGRDQLLDEISERAEEYYNALWRTCAPNEQLVLMQVAQTGLVNGKTRKDVRRLLARGLLRRDPQLRLMNETFRRFVLAQCATSALALQLEQNLASDAWNRFRVPFFAAIAVVLLFFFTTQRQTFDSTLALIGGLAASLPAFVKTLSGLGNRARSG